MPLILAIESDRRQASRLTAIVRGRLHADLVLGDSAERALAALGEQVPDLILTSALLSPKDEAALGERLRSLNGAAAHVHTLTIPVLASSAGSARGEPRVGGILSAFLGDKTAAAADHDGCDPEMFADQCREYLERAATERALAEEVSLAAAAPPEASGADGSATSSDTAGDEALAQPERFALPDDDDAPESLMAAVAALAAEEDGTVPPAHDPVAVDRRSGPEHNLSALLDDLSPRPGALVADHDVDEDVPVYGIDDDGSLASLDTRESADARETLDPDEPLDARAQSDAAAPAAIEDIEESAPVPVETARYDAMPLAGPACWPALEGLIAGAQGFDDVSDEVDGAAAHSSATADTDDLDDWMDIIEALRRETQQIPSTNQPATVPAGWPGGDGLPGSAPGPSGAGGDHAGTRKRKSSVSAAEDEWGFFDPDRAGLAALIAKLEEITEQDDTAAAPQP